jgi:glycosyltransferase involved in cell wall biosynthesis
MPIGLDATYSLGPALSGVGVYCREILWGLAATYPEQRFQFWYRPHRFFRSFKERLPPNCSRSLLHDRWWTPGAVDVFHGLNQRLPVRRMKRAVTTFHDLFVMTSAYSTLEFRQRFTRLAREAAEKSDLIVTVSQFTADQVCGLLGVEPTRVRVIHHGVRKREAAKKPRENIVLHVGAIQQRKNVLRLVQAFERFADPDWRLVLAGSAGYGAAEIGQWIARSPVRPRIEITGFVSDIQLAELYSRASIFAFPSLDEGFGMPVLEAMAAEIPVICSGTSALPEVAGGAALLVDPLSVEEIGDALQQLMRDRGLRQDLTRRGVDRAAGFTWEKALRKTWQIYHELL